MSDRICTICGKEKPDSEFPKARTTTYIKKNGCTRNYVLQEQRCTDCRRKHAREYQREYQFKKRPPQGEYGWDYSFVFECKPYG